MKPASQPWTNHFEGRFSVGKIDAVVGTLIHGLRRKPVVAMQEVAISMNAAP